eukprot:3086733-Lingulodinium_polyedra.AAC.1
MCIRDRTSELAGRSLLTASVSGCLNDSLQACASHSAKLRWREPCAQLLVWRRMPIERGSSR